MDHILDWQGKGYGAPRVNARGEQDGRFGLDPEVHVKEHTDVPRNVPLEQRRAYQTQLDMLAAEKAVAKSANRKQSVALALKSDETKGLGKPGYGAPLRKGSKVVTQTGKVSIVYIDLMHFNVCHSFARLMTNTSICPSHRQAIELLLLR